MRFGTIYEHHFREESSHSSAPEVFLAAAGQRIRNIDCEMWREALEVTTRCMTDARFRGCQGMEP